jgi:2-dehydro-3-deoxygluconokinase
MMSLLGNGIRTEHIDIYFLETSAAQRGSKVIYDHANSSFATIQTGTIDWEKVFEGADWFHWTGITEIFSLRPSTTSSPSLTASSATRSWAG